MLPISTNNFNYLVLAGGVVEDGEDLDPNVQDYSNEDYNDVFDTTSNG